MIDWFVLLVPFAVLPLVLIFGFVGCVLDTEGTGVVPKFIYPPGLPSPIGSVLILKVDMTVTGAEKATASDSSTLRVSDSTLKPQGDIVEFDIDMDSIGAKEDGTAVCIVTLTISGNPIDTTGPLPPVTHTNPTADFTLTVTAPGNTLADFTLT